ncbi:cellulose synthase regulator BcsB [Lonsdalea populi]|uniref:cellulose biosynthesis cyclic di-GMP-binding regulatory protein BcsB n=1 Tax=Lonsdalea TaxID=1082702 RepID=UPI000A1E7C34|nr:MULTISPECIES: cellulose biosynthesis cyclic di-GMP-binding regulatory protein BcsB [Lonsdalea]OSN01390.1 cellulose synthase regulator BcsB [Lonsdalea populi]QPQ24127.1 cellulose biosynthesis cyclic di-GMP-binding regulatory protein BcsB [Lonsdalea populi]RAT15432.1 cellulose synthase regulator BcsB [Lonsdalea quercina]RAT28191.1 cellulose synthase regulator BcsB [Lonsdalea populi]RAT29838.1 cellulose synthase regulator BcsB [Lonsdalea populi]
MTYGVSRTRRRFAAFLLLCFVGGVAADEAARPLSPVDVPLPPWLPNVSPSPVSSPAPPPELTVPPAPDAPPDIASNAPPDIDNEPFSSTISVAQMGQTQGVALSGGQLQAGLRFTLPADQVVTSAHLALKFAVSTALAERNTALQLMLNGQPLGNVPLTTGGQETGTYQIEIPAALVVSDNNLSFRIINSDRLLCGRDNAHQYSVTILPSTTLQLEGQQLNVGADIGNFPRPFIDAMQMATASVPMIFPAEPTADQVSAAALVASWMGVKTNGRDIAFPVARDRVPEQNGILFGYPGQKIGRVTLPQVDAPTLQLMDNPDNPIYKLLLVVGKDEDQLRQAAYYLVSQPLIAKQSAITVTPQTLPRHQSYDAPRWISTDRRVRFSELLEQEQSMTSLGIWHSAQNLKFRAAPDLFLWDGETIPVHISYRFPAESWIDEHRSDLNVTLNGTFISNLPMVKAGLLERLWRRLGGDNRQESYTLKLDPYLIYGFNQLQLYFNIRPKADAPCSVLLNNNIKSRIENDSWIDLTHTRHFTMLPNLSYFIGASFPFSRLADYAQTVMLLPERPTDQEISTLLGMAGRSGDATGVSINRNQVVFGVPKDGVALHRLQNSDVLAVTTLSRAGFNAALLAESPYQTDGHALGVKMPSVLEKWISWLTGDWSRHPIDADRYFSSNEFWRGFVSYRSPWNPKRVAVVALATNDQQLQRLHGDLMSTRITAAIRGDTAIITDENGIRSFRVGPQFPSGQMPWYMMIIWYANQHAVILAFVALIVASLGGAGLYRVLKRRAYRRLHPQDARDPGRK